MTDLLIEDDPPPLDDPLEDDLPTDDQPPAALDAPPQSDDGEVAQCPFCEKSWQGTLRNAWRSNHIKFQHRDEAAAESLSEPSGPAPKKAASRRKPRSDRAPTGTSSSQLRQVRENVILFYQMGGMVASFRDPVCGPAIAASAEAAAAAWVTLAKRNDAVRKFWSAGGGANGWLELAMAHVPIALAIRDHHVYPLIERSRYEREMMAGDGEPFDVDEASGQSFQDDLAGYPAPIVVGWDGDAVPPVPDSGLRGSIGDIDLSAGSPFEEGGLG